MKDNSNKNKKRLHLSHFPLVLSKFLYLRISSNLERRTNGELFQNFAGRNFSEQGKLHNYLQ